MAVPESLRKRVARRAKNRCEYCGLSQIGQAATFHVDHVLPQSAGGETSMENLALACIHCSLRKGARVRLFHPREDFWNQHFRWMAFRLKGITAIGRATIEAQSLNSSEHLIIRGFEKSFAGIRRRGICEWYCVLSSIPAGMIPQQLHQPEEVVFADVHKGIEGADGGEDVFVCGRRHCGCA